ncbi:MAG: 50S ribosomal protein L35 [Candidatus Gracilibacteria bacterium]|nr:50S ribosomal protein L35 [Candidatus Gracilibacteria bacterium]
MLKTRSGVKKRTKVTGTGKILLEHTGKKHLLSNKAKKAKGRDKYGLEVNGVEKKKIKIQLPFSS